MNLSAGSVANERASRAVSLFKVPDLGVGVGLRVPHYAHVLERRPVMDFFEIISENFLVQGGSPLYHLSHVLETYRVVPHGVSLSIGAPSEPDRAYLTALKGLLRRVNAPWISDHLCWCAAGGAHLHELLPLPYTMEVVERVAERARRVQDYLEVPLALENTSSYLAYRQSSMNEWQFISEVLERANVALLFDVNNAYVSARNHGFEPGDFVRNVPHERIVQIHLAGHSERGAYLLDTHSTPVCDPVWELYQQTIELCGPVSTLIEWDESLPEFAGLAREAARARQVRDEAVRRRGARSASAMLTGGQVPLTELA